MTRHESLGPRSRRLIRAVLTGGGSRAGSLLVALLVTPILLQGLGFERYGIWALAGAAAGYLGLLDLGFGNGFVRFLARHAGQGDIDRFNGVMRTGIAVYAVIGAAIFPLIVLMAPSMAEMIGAGPGLRDEAVFLLIGVAAIFIFRSIFSVYRAALTAAERLDINNKLDLLASVAGGLGAVVAVESGYGLTGLVVNGMAIAVLAVAAQMWAAYRVEPRIRILPFRLDRESARELFGYGLRVQGARLAEIVNGQADKIILGVMVSAASVGLYDLGMKVSLMAGVLPSLMLPAVLPASAILEAKGDSSALEELHQRSIRYLALLLAPGTAFVLVAASPILGFWIGREDLGQASVAARLLVLGSAPHLALGVSRLVARGIGAPTMEMRASLLMAGLNVVLSLALVPILGPLGAPLGTCVAGIAGGLCFLVAFRKEVAGRFRLDPLRPLAAPAAAAAIAAIAGAAGLMSCAALQVQEGRAGDLARLAATAVPFLAVYLLALRKLSPIDALDRRVARETWLMARGSIGRTEAAP